MRHAADKYILRLPNGWRDAIKEKAARNRRSMNQEILAALESVVSAATTGVGLVNQAPVVAPSHSDALQGAGQFHPQHQEC